MWLHKDKINSSVLFVVILSSFLFTVIYSCISRRFEAYCIHVQETAAVWLASIVDRCVVCGSTLMSQMFTSS